MRSSEADLAKPDVLLNENHPPPKPGEPIREKWSFRRSNYFPFVGEECLNVRDNVGLQDMSAFAKALVSGPGARGLARLDPRQPHPEEESAASRSATC